MFSGRKGQATQAGTFVVIMALLIVLYLLLLPPDTRGELLGENGTQNPVQRDIYLSFVPDANVDSGLQTRQLPTFQLQTAVQGNQLAERSAVSAKTSIFHSDTDTIRFLAPANTQNVLVSFSVAQAKGTLELVLNGELVYSAALARMQPEPIELPTNLLQEDNTLEVRVSSVGFSFWDTNVYELRNFQITADVRNYDRASQTQRFIVQDAASIQAAALEFVPDCFEASGRLEISHNQNMVYSGFPTCGVPLSLDLAPGQMLEGENFLLFSLYEGEYLIDQAELLIAREPEGQNSEFTLTQQEITDISARGSNVMLSMSFEQAGARGSIIVNGQELTFRTNEQSFANAITPYIRTGTNSVSLQSSSIPVTLIEVYEE